VAALRESALGRLFGRAPDYGELYDLLRQAGANIRRSTALLSQLISRWPEEDGERHDLVDCEHEGDRITHDIIHHLYRRAATPFEQADLLALASGLDDVVDYAEEVADFLFLYRVEAPMEQAVALAAVLEQAGAELADALDGIDQVDGLPPHLSEIGRLEDEGDRIERECLAALFEGGIDPMLVIRWKDIVERLEQGIDSCDHVGHVLEGVVVKNA
jgi:predicted phosphate transport protein (TIGR00153 family)